MVLKFYICCFLAWSGAMSAGRDLGTPRPTLHHRVRLKGNEVKTSTCFRMHPWVKDFPSTCLLMMSGIYDGGGDWGMPLVWTEKNKETCSSTIMIGFIRASYNVILWNQTGPYGMGPCLTCPTIILHIWSYLNRFGHVWTCMRPKWQLARISQSTPIQKYIAVTMPWFRESTEQHQ